MSHDEEPKKAHGGKHAGETTTSVLKEAAWTGIARSAIEPWLRKTAERFGASVPADSWLRSEMGEHALGGLKQVVEEYAKHFPQPWALIAETATDFLDMAGLHENGKHAEKPQVTAVAATWMNEFYKHAVERLEKAPTDKLAEEKLRLEKEFEIRKSLVELMQTYIDSEPKKSEEPTGHEVHPIDWDEELEKLNKAFEIAATPPIFINERTALIPAVPMSILFLSRALVGLVLLFIIFLAIFLY